MLLVADSLVQCLHIAVSRFFRVLLFAGGAFACFGRVGSRRDAQHDNWEALKLKSGVSMNSYRMLERERRSRIERLGSCVRSCLLWGGGGGFLAPTCPCDANR